ncbi:MAG TPA: sugar phosphate nucleotidyltransferase [Bacteroidales bacterium]|nr:sugar phosphate nucleotidyltransferase [Bacteroidales bacterium]
MPKAMILAAGLGTRLLPLTLDQPKALVLVAGKPMIVHVIERLKQYGFDDIIVNLHYHGEKLKQFLSSEKFEGMNFTFSDESEQLLDTGGAIGKAKWFFDNEMPFLVHNCDIISYVPIDKMIEFHVDRKAIATLAVSKRKTSRPLAFDQQSGLIDRFDPAMNKDIKALAYSGICVLDKNIFSFMPEKGVFSIIDVFVKASKSSIVAAYEHEPDIWVDAGSIKNIEKAEQLLKNVHL